MRVGYDGKRIFKNYTGLGNYSRYILFLMGRHYPQNENLIYTPGTGNGPFKEEILSNPRNTIFTPESGIFKSLWRSFGIVKDLKKDKVDLFHGLSNEIPFGIHKHLPSVATVHDVIFLRFPQYYGKVDGLIYKFKTAYACRRATRIIAVSERTKLDLVHFFGTAPDKISVVYQDSSKNFKRSFSPAQFSEISSRHNLPAKFLLSVGTIEERKNLLLIVQALKLVPEIPLVVIGKEKQYATSVKNYIRENGLENRVIFLKNVSDNDLPGIYQLASVFIYPSRYEGFGIPIVEALHSGTPVIAATGSCLEEAGGPGSLYTDPDNFEQLASLIKLVLNDPEKRQQMIDGGKKHVALFDDELISKQLMDVYLKAIHDAKR